jgi:hypothetical protein
MQPETIQLGLESSPPGAQLSYGGLAVTAPARRTAAVGFHTTVSAPAELVSGGARFTFDRWSDGGARLHDIAVPDRDTVLTAAYRPVAAAPAGAVLGTSGSSPRRAAQIKLDGRTVRPSTRRLRGRVLRASGRLRVDVALRSRRVGKGCRWWHRALGRLDARPHRCDRLVWMKAVVDRSGHWRVDLGKRPLRARYVLLMRARTSSARPRVIARATSGIRFR